MDTKNSKFHQGFAQRVREVESFGFKKCSRNFLGSLLALQEVEFPPTLVISCLRAIQWPLGSALTVGLVKGSLDYAVDIRKTGFLVYFGSRDYHFRIGYVSRCLRVL